MKKVAAMSQEEIQKLMAQMMAPRENKNPRDILFQMTKKEKEEASELVWEEIAVDPAAKMTEVSLTALPESVTAYKITLV